jgi:hypothetical protein
MYCKTVVVLKVVREKYSMSYIGRETRIKVAFGIDPGHSSTSETENNKFFLAT